MNLRSNQTALGNDSDPALHFGVGVKYAITQYISARLDFRDNLMQENREPPGDRGRRSRCRTSSCCSACRSRSAARRPKPLAPPQDSDGDGFMDPQDACPTQPGVAPNGCPAPVAAPVDTDKDGIVDPERSLPDRGRRRRSARARRRLSEQGRRRRRRAWCPTTSARPKRASRPTAARQGQGRRRHPRRRRQVPRPAGDEERLPGRRRLPGRATQRGRQVLRASSRASSSTSARRRSARSRTSCSTRPSRCSSSTRSAHLDQRPHRQRRRRAKEPRAVAGARRVREGVLGRQGHRHQPHRDARRGHERARRRQRDGQGPSRESTHRVQAAAEVKEFRLRALPWSPAKTVGGVTMRSTVIWSFLSVVALAVGGLLSGCDSDATIAKSGVGESCDSTADCNDDLKCLQGACYKSCRTGERRRAAKATAPAARSSGPPAPVLGERGRELYQARRLQGRPRLLQPALHRRRPRATAATATSPAVRCSVSTARPARSRGLREPAWAACPVATPGCHQASQSGFVGVCSNRRALAWRRRARTA